MRCGIIVQQRVTKFPTLTYTSFFQSGVVRVKCALEWRHPTVHANSIDTADMRIIFVHSDTAEHSPFPPKSEWSSLEWRHPRLLRSDVRNAEAPTKAITPARIAAGNLSHAWITVCKSSSAAIGGHNV
jgi:hypothetical protein